MPAIGVTMFYHLGKCFNFKNNLVITKLARGAKQTERKGEKRGGRTKLGGEPPPPPPSVE
jgi:hypothetical protein